ncbi:MAG TPA: hypothetical protein VJX72_01265 [Candidatus Acidoferrum sp.]|nr:hypothetical protein [Candidatus Acidoferrum sp.]
MPSSHDRGSRRTTWQLCVAVLLVGLLLYNPFLALISHSDGLAYQALARHRATVGASELQHYPRVHGEKAQPEVSVEEAFVAVTVENNESASHIFEDEALPPRPELKTSVWFRPPPTA